MIMWIDGLAVKNSQICHGFFIVGFTDHDKGNLFNSFNSLRDSQVLVS